MKSNMNEPLLASDMGMPPVLPPPRRDSMAESMLLSCHDMSFSVSVPKKGGRGLFFPEREEKQLLSGLNFEFRPGTCTALMGPSGAGKTTLLMALAGHNHNVGRVRGDIRLNGEKLPRNYKELSCLIPQDDVLLPGLSPREMLGFTSALKLDAPKEERMAKVQEVLEVLSLTECADAIIGSVDRKGISGGQRKRVSVGMEMLTHPSVIFVDEATSGLDSKTARDVSELLRDLARQNCTVICTIHQPSYKIFAAFDMLVLLSKGRLCYFGSVADCSGHFAAFGLEVPLNDNPADAYMRWLQDPEKRDEIVARGEELYPHLEEEDGDFDDAASIVSTFSERMFKISVTTHYPVPRWKQFFILFYRHLLNDLKDWRSYLTICLMKGAIGFIIGLIWMDQAGNEQDNIFTTESALFIITNTAFQDAVFFMLLALPLIKALLLREYRNGYYCMPAWFWATALGSGLLAIPPNLVFAVMPYYMMGMQSDFANFFQYWMLNMALVASALLIGMAVGARAANIDDARSGLVPINLKMFVFSGFLIPYDDIPGWLQWVYWINPVQYVYSLLCINEFDGREYDDCDRSSAGEVCGEFLQCAEDGDDVLDDLSTDADEVQLRSGVLVAIIVAYAFWAYYAVAGAIRNA